MADDDLENKLKKESSSRSEELVRQGFLTSDEGNRSLAAQFGMPLYLDLSSYTLPREYFKKIPYAFAKKNVIMPIKEENGAVLVAVSDPLNLSSPSKTVPDLSFLDGLDRFGIF